MKLRFILPALFLLAGCVSSGNVDPLKTQKGRQEAHDAYVQLGIGYLQQGSPSRAKIPLRKALELDPRSTNAHAALALVFQAEMEHKLADEHFRQSLASGEARAFNNYGSFLFEQKRYDEAFQRFLKASEDTMYPERARVFENLGLTAIQLGRRDEAKQYFNRAVRLDGRRPAALLELAVLHYDDQEFVPARRYYDSFAATAPQSARSLLLGIRLARVFDNREQAASLAAQLKRVYPASAEYKTYLAEQ